MEAEATRRELVRGGVGLAAASLAVGAAIAEAAAPASSQEQALARALEIERTAVIAYRQALASGVLTPTAQEQLRALMAQDQQHVSKLEQILSRMGAAIPPGPRSVTGAQALLGRHEVDRSLTELPTQRDCLRLLIDVESLAEGAYFAAIPALEDAALIRVSVEIMGADAQHWAALSALQHRDDVTKSVPYPFVQGSP